MLFGITKNIFKKLLGIYSRFSYIKNIRCLFQLNVKVQNYNNN